MNGNTVEFVLRMRDMMSGGLSRLSAASQSAFGRMAQHADRMNQRNRVLGLSFDELQRRIREVENTVRTSTIPSQIASARRELTALQRQANNHAGNLNSGGGSGGSGGGFSVGGMAVGSMLGGLATQAGTALLGIVKDGIGGAIAGSMEKQQAITGLTTFLGKDGANEAYKNIRKDADISPFDTPSLLAVNRALISAGLNAKDAREDSMNLANAISAVGGGNAELQRMAANMQQIKTVGKATAMDIKQFGMVGINIYEMLAKSTGKSIAEVKDMEVSYDQLAKAMAMARGKGGLYEGALEAQGNTMAGKWSTVKDKFGGALTDIGDAFAPVITKVLDLAVKIADGIAPMLQKMQPYIDMISGGLGAAIDSVFTLGEGTGTWGDWLAIAKDYVMDSWNFLKKVFSVVTTIVGGLIDWLSKSEMIKDVFRMLVWLMEKTHWVVGKIGDALVWVWNNVLRPILDGLDQAYKWVKELVTGEKVVSVKTDLADPKVPKGPSAPTAPSYSANLTRFSNAGVGSAIDEAEKKKKKNKETSHKTGESISGGGPRTINITLGKFFDNLQFTTLNTGETEEQMEKIVMQCMGRVLYEGAKNM